MANTFKQGKFTPRHPEKYIGDVNNIIFRSSWELEAFKFFDNNVAVLEWGSEIIAIPYLKPTDSKVHRYFPDIYVKFQKKDGIVTEELIEIKPEKETRQPTTRGKSLQTQQYEAITWAINKAKWQSASKWCKERNIKFRILTENSLFR